MTNKLSTENSLKISPQLSFFSEIQVDNKLVIFLIGVTLAGKMLKIAERSEAKSAKRRLGSKIQI